MKNALQGAQMLFVAFGALVLVPLLTGLDPNVASLVPVSVLSSSS
ncbi:uracil permease [Vibrio sp. JCM 19053]|nr:uracil permease [Vibrio sp. JCM 19053]